MRPPIPIPTQRKPFSNHLAAKIEAIGLYAPRSRPGTARRSGRGAFHRLAADQDVTLRANASRAPEEKDKAIPCSYSRRIRTWVAR